YGVIESNELSVLPIAFIIGAVLYFIYGLIEKNLIKEKNFISFQPDEIEYKNSFRKPQNIKINNLLDLRIETAKVEFVLNNQHIRTYDFSVFEEPDIDRIYKELEKIKASLG
ncbi:MAG TPA: hypothetical protein P5210_16335, partial [Draconibacterium sp.]|nr:hypothetical protein [Draconibacterium sp.]